MFTGRISVIIPAWNEEAWIAGAVRGLYAAGDVEVLVVDGGSRDATIAEARNAGARVISSARGRGIQMNTGAAAATGDLLMFLHADARLSPDAFPVVRAAFTRQEVRIATFRRSFDRREFWLNVSSAISRIDTFWTRFGDQGIVVRRSFFEQLGGYPEWKILEDVHLLRAARRLTRSGILPATITVSTRRFDRTGVVGGQLSNAGHLLRYLLGISPEKIAAAYEGRIETGITTEPARTEGSRHGENSRRNDAPVRGVGST